MRIVSWNLGSNPVSKAHHDAAWRFLLDPAGLNADVALVQEAVVPDEVWKTHHVHWRRAWPNSRGHEWGTGIIASREFQLTSVERAVPDTRFVMARLAAARRDFVVVSIHAFTTMRADYFDDVSEGIGVGVLAREVRVDDVRRLCRQRREAARRADRCSADLGATAFRHARHHPRRSANPNGPQPRRPDDTVALRSHLAVHPVSGHGRQSWTTSATAPINAPGRRRHQPRID